MAKKMKGGWANLVFGPGRDILAGDTVSERMRDEAEKAYGYTNNVVGPDGKTWHPNEDDRAGDARDIMDNPNAPSYSPEHRKAMADLDLIRMRYNRDMEAQGESGDERDIQNRGYERPMNRGLGSRRDWAKKLFGK